MVLMDWATKSSSRGAVVLSVLTIIWTVLVAKAHLISLAPIFSVSVLIALIVVTFLGRFRSIAGGSGLLAAATIVVIASCAAVSYGGFRPFRHLSFGTAIFAYVLVLALAFECLVPSELSAQIHPASTVSVAAFMIVPTLAVDVTTGYHGQGPSFMAALVIACAPLLQRLSSTLVRHIARLLEPVVAVSIGWAVAYYGYGNAVYRSDLWWLLKLLAVPAVAAAACGVLKQAFLTRMRRVRTDLP